MQLNHTLRFAMIATAIVTLLTLSFGQSYAAVEQPSSQQRVNNAACAGVIFFSDIDQRDQVFQACQTTRFATMPGSWDNRVSSFSTGARILIYENPGFSGKCRGIGANEYWGNLTQIPMRNGLSWNDQISSFIVNPSNWEWLNCR